MRACSSSRGPNRPATLRRSVLRSAGPDRSERRSGTAFGRSVVEAAVVTIVGTGDGKVPCINAVHFLRREAGLLVSYFARGQDIFQKFYADGICVFEMATTVAEGLRVPVAEVRGLVSSAHVYLTICRRSSGFWRKPLHGATTWDARRGTGMKAVLIVARCECPKQTYREYPLGVGMIATSMRRDGHDVASLRPGRRRRRRRDDRRPPPAGGAGGGWFLTDDAELPGQPAADPAA